MNIETIETWGFTPNMIPENTNGIPARITAVHKERYALICEHGEIYGKLKTKEYYGGGNEKFPTAGDFVMIAYNQFGDSQITATLPRKTFFSRRDPSPSIGEQAVAANFDYVFIIQSLNHDFNTKRLERYLSISWQSGAVPVVLLTKADLEDDFSSQIRAAQIAAPGVSVFAVSAKTGYGIENLKEFLKPRKTIVFLGSSGVGKSSLVNAFAKEEIMSVNNIREDDSRGRHTTTHRQLIMLQNGVMIIDTPGMREIGIWDADSGIDDAFSDVEQYIGKCKFRDCKHISEPGCAVKDAIKRGELSIERWESYQKLKTEAEFSGDKAKFLKGKQQRNRAIAIYQKQLKANDNFQNTPCTETFTCKVCGTIVAPEGAGTTQRNHCPNCLSSLHVDNTPGDRASLCKGVMEPIGVWVRKNGEWAIIHRCKICGKLNSNRVAADDNPALLMSIAVKPLAVPPFPLGDLSKLYKNNTAEE